jgi:predicted CXXCH cytochrome family protein
LGPHSGYSTTSSKCGVCHSVHGAASGQLLLPTSVADACSYCHMNTSSGYTQVYGGVIDNYNVEDLPNAHNSFTDAGIEQGVQCADCHQVHGAEAKMTSNPFLSARLLIGDKDYDPTANDGKGNYDVNAQAPLADDDKDTALSKWCAGCHYTRNGAYSYWGSYDGPSHVMTSAGESYGNPNMDTNEKVAWADSSYCSSCHASDYGTSAWPHMTEGNRFLVVGANVNESIPASETTSDGVCLRCHRDGAGAGVGESF